MCYYVYIDELIELIRDRFPTAKLNLDPAQTATGSSFLDIEIGSYALNVEWRPEHGFGLTSASEIVYGEGASETYPDVGSASRRVLRLLATQTETAPPFGERLRKIRLERRLTQDDVARRLGVRQPAVSRLVLLYRLQPQFVL